jgi:E3 ubiquitin-protein ligase RNF144
MAVDLARDDPVQEVLDLSSPGAELRSRGIAAAHAQRAEPVLLLSSDDDDDEDDSHGESGSELGDLSPLPELGSDDGLDDADEGPPRQRRRLNDPQPGGHTPPDYRGHSLLQTCACGASYRKGWEWTHACPVPRSAGDAATAGGASGGAAAAGTPTAGTPTASSPGGGGGAAAAGTPTAGTPTAASSGGGSDDDVVEVGATAAARPARPWATGDLGGALEVVGEAAAARKHRSRGLTRKRAFECPICMCDCEPADAFTLCCGCGFCAACLGQYVAGKVQEGQVALTQLTCPSIECKAALSPHDVQMVLASHVADGPGLWAKFDEFRLRGVVEREKAGRHCPGKGCGYMFFAEEAAALGGGGAAAGGADAVGVARPQRFDCPRCEGSFCLACNAGWHQPPESCLQAAARRRAEEGTDGDEELLEYVRDQGLKKCPSCALLVAKMDGCNAVTCRCGIIFCFVCALQLHTAGLPEKRFGPDGEEQPYCTCNEWGVNAHRGKPVGAALGGAAAGMAADVARPQEAAARAAAAVAAAAARGPAAAAAARGRRR